MRFSFQVLFALVVLCLIPLVPAFAAHGGGGGGAGHSSGGAGGYAHSGYSGTAHYYSGSSYAPRSGNYLQGNYIHSGNANLSQSPQSYHHYYNGVGNWGYHDWNPYFRGSYWGYGWNGWWGYPFWFGYWGGYPFYWGGYWGDYFCPYGSLYATEYPMAIYYPYADDGQYAANYAPSPAPVPDNPQSSAEDGEAAANEGLQYYNEARAAFAQGDYRNALRLAGHAGVESPRNPKVHELTLLALFASGDYRDAATEAHAALALGAPSDWPHLYAYYNNNDRYTEHLRTLEKTVADTPASAPAQFLLGYHYLMTGAKDEAKQHFAQAAKLTPNDKLAQHILKQLESGGAVTPPTLPKPPVEQQKGKLL